MKASKREEKTNFHVIFATRNLGPSLKTYIETVHEMKKPKSYENFKKGGENKFSHL